MLYTKKRKRRAMSEEDIQQDRSAAFPKQKSIKMQAIIDACKRKSCEICGNPCEGEPHHIKTRGAGGSDAPENLIQLCGNCHREAHAGKISKERLYRVVARRLRISEEELYRRLRAIDGAEEDDTHAGSGLRSILEQEARRDSRRKAVPFS